MASDIQGVSLAVHYCQIANFFLGPSIVGISCEAWIRTSG